MPMPAGPATMAPLLVRVPKSAVPKMPTPLSVTVILPVLVLVTLGPCRPKLPLPPLMPAVTLPELRIEPVPVSTMPAPPSPTVTVPLLVTLAPLMAEMPAAPAPPVMVPELVIWLLAPATIPNPRLPTEMVPRFEVMLLLLRVMPECRPWRPAARSR